jgi:hypothetical protein
VHQLLSHEASKAIPGAEHASPYQFGHLPVTVGFINSGHDVNAARAVALVPFQRRDADALFDVPIAGPALDR